MDFVKLYVTLHDIKYGGDEIKNSRTGINLAEVDLIEIDLTKPNIPWVYVLTEYEREMFIGVNANEIRIQYT